MIEGKNHIKEGKMSTSNGSENKKENGLGDIHTKRPP